MGGGGGPPQEIRREVHVVQVDLRPVPLGLRVSAGEVEGRAGVGGEAGGDGYGVGVGVDDEVEEKKPAGKKKNARARMLEELKAELEAEKAKNKAQTDKDAATIGYNRVFSFSRERTSDN